MKNKPWLIGLVQALGVIIYCGLISGLFQLLKIIAIQPPEFLIATFMLTLLVFSAAIMGATVFGYPVYLAINKQIKPAIKILLFTFLFLFLIASLVITTIAIV